MLTLDEDDFVRPVGVTTPAGRSPLNVRLNVRQIVTVTVVLALGGGLGTGAYFLSNIPSRDIIGFLDVDDPGRAKLSLVLPGTEPAAPTSRAGELLTPPGMAGKSAGDSVASALAPKTAPLPPTGAVPVSVSVPGPSAHPVGTPPSYANLPTVPQAKPLPPAPAKELLADSANGPLPAIGVDGRQPWRVYARPFADAGKPRVGVLITGLGLERTGTEAAIFRLPADVSLSFSPYAQDLATWIRKAREAGHEALVDLPFAADGIGDGGPLGLSATASRPDNAAHLEKVLAAAPGVAGVFAAPPPTFTASTQFAPILKDLAQRGVMYVGSEGNGAHSVAATDVSLVADQDPWREAIDTRLAAAAKAAKTQGPVVVVASASPLTFDRLSAWFAGLAGEGLAIAPVSSIAKPPGKS